MRQRQVIKNVMVDGKWHKLDRPIDVTEGETIDVEVRVPAGYWPERIGFAIDDDPPSVTYKVGVI